MTTIDLTKVQAASFLPGLQDLGSPADQSYHLGAVTIPAGGVTNLSVVVPFSRSDVFSQIRVAFSGMSNVSSSEWIPLFGQTTVGDVNQTAFSPAASYYVIMQVVSNSAGRQINLQFANNTSSSIVTTPDLTLLVHSHLYAYPWL